MFNLYFVFVSLLIVSGCMHAKKSGEQAEESRVVKSVVAQSSLLVERDFAGLATPMEEVNLAFKISGQILSLPATKGALVEKDEVLASLDPRDVELQLEANRSAYEQALSRLDRARRLLEHEAVSEQEVESAQSLFSRAKSSYENSKETLLQTKLRAPFSAIVERVDVEAYERVQPGETVMRIVSPNTRQVEFTVPESSLSTIRDSSTRYKVRFDNLPEVVFDAEIFEYARTTSDASGFPASLLIDNSKNYYISPGMSCTITMISRQGEDDAIRLPLSAIYAPVGGETYVWVIGENDRVEKQRVSLLMPSSQNSVVVDGGLKVGERVVSAGVYQLSEGDKVRIIK